MLVRSRIVRATQFLSSTTVLLQRLTSHSPYTRKPMKLNRPASAGHFTTKSEHRRFGDPTPLMPSSHVHLFRCSWCHRVRHIPQHEVDWVHYCCEGRQMRRVSTVRKAMTLHDKLTKLVRMYDPVDMKPRSNLHKPASRHRSKLPKK